MKQINEGSAKILIPKASDKLISKEMGVFYNPRMKLNRDITVLLLNSVENTEMKMADIMAGTGVRSIRLLKELKKGKLGGITINDYDPRSVELIRKNLLNNDLDSDERIMLENKDASILLLESKGFDYIDIDPFGSPNQYLDAAVKRISRGGILAVTATDTAALSGSVKAAGMRKYWASPSNNSMMHETGIRILARKVQLIGAQYDKALVPIFSYAFEHYYRIFFRNDKGKKKVDGILQDHKYILACGNCLNFSVDEKNSAKCDACGAAMDFIGPLYAGNLFDGGLVKRMKNNLSESAGDDAISPASKQDKEVVKLLSLADEEAKMDITGFFDLHELCENLRISVPKYDKIMDALREKKFNVSRTIFSDRGIKTDADISTVTEVLKKFK